MKKTYMNPAMTVVKLQHQCMVCVSYVQNYSNSTGEGIGYGGAGGDTSASSEANVKGNSSIWDEEW
ncbi:MAG: hypothetical protein IJS63_08850 [Bacteroidaceae bacterium]|nr:hypothetical protein [Bacteroidaceae bacterium]